MRISEQVIQSEYLSALLGSIDASVVATNSDFEIEYWNKFAEQIFEQTAEEVMSKRGSAVFNFVYPDHKENEARQILIQKGHWRGHVYYTRKSGKQILLDVSVSTVRNNSGKIVGYVGVHRDITEYDKIKANYATLLSIFSTIDDNFFIVDNDLKVIFVDDKSNKNISEYYGISYQVGDYIIDKLPGHRKQVVKENLLNAFKGEKTSYEVNVHDRNGKSIWLQGNYFPIKEQDGIIIHVCLIVRDISAKKDVELVKEKLYQSRRLFETFMENSPILAWITDKEGIIRYLNPAYLKNYQLNKDCVNKHLCKVFPESYCKAFLENDKIVLKSDTSLKTIESGITPDNREHIYQVLKFPLHTEGETYVGGWAIDVTEEVLLRDSLNQSLHRLEQSEKDLKLALQNEHHLNDLKSRFVSMASHEFRTPLSTMLTSAFLLEKYTTTEQQQNRIKHVQKIQEAISHMNNLLDDFLSLGKFEEGKMIVNPAPLNIDDLINDTIEDLQPLMKNGQRIHYVPANQSEVISDKKFLKNILVNLLSNAFKFSGENKNIWITNVITDHSICISVKDEGIGISKEDQQHLFETFFRARNAQNIQGTGLGLHIIRRYVELLKGKIEIESKLNKGTLVTMSLPA